MMTTEYASVEPAREEVDRLAGATLLEFGAPWCPHCQRVQPFLARALASHPSVRHIKIEDGKGRPLGRSYRVKLWPTLICLRDGRETERLVRPTDAEAIVQALDRLDPPGSAS